MEFLKVAKRHSFWSEIAYIGLNLALVAAILGVVWAVESPLPAFGLVILSKWRILAVRPRYWFANIVSNLVDIIVSLSLVVFLYAASGAWVAQVVIALLYAAWLLALKPRSKRSFVVLQAGVGLFVGVMALAMQSADWYASFVVIGFWIIGYSTARHALLAHGEHAHLSLLSLTWGLIMAELGWLTYHWTIAYELIGVGEIKLPQVAIVALLLSFLAERIYISYIHNDRTTVRFAEVLLPTLLTVSVVVIMLVLFNAAPNSLN